MRILIFGTGSGPGDLLSVVSADIATVGFGDNHAHKHGSVVHEKLVYVPQTMGRLEFDCTVVFPRHGVVVRNQLVDLGVLREKILVFYSTYVTTLRHQVNQRTEALNHDLGLGLHSLPLCTTQMWPIPYPDTEPSQDDYRRSTAIGLSAQRILTKNDRFIATKPKARNGVAA